MSGDPGPAPSFQNTPAVHNGNTNIIANQPVINCHKLTDIDYDKDFIKHIVSH
jgi:hypothetical protein